MALNFYHKRRLEQLRVIEPSLNLPDINSDLYSHGDIDYDQWLLQRITHAENNEQVNTILNGAKSYYSRIVISLALLALFCGVVAMVSLTANGGSTLNIFWLLGALLGLHTLLLIVWLIFAILNRDHSNGLISGLSHWVFHKAFQVSDPSNIQRLANYTWFSTTFATPMQKWRLSALSHLWWCCFLSGNLLGLIFIFTTKQFDFSWESTLLKNSDFGTVMQFIATPLQAINISTPLDNISEQTPLTLDSESRRQWALFILACLSVYGLLPRTLALGFSYLIIAWHQRHWSLDNSLPYYIHLKKYTMINIKTL